MRFADVVGHSGVKDRLIRMVAEDRLPHALLLSAPEGSGEMMLARALAQYVHCTGRRPGDTDSCGHLSLKPISQPPSILSIGVYVVWGEKK